MTDFLFLGSKVTVNDDCSHEIRRCLLHGRKGMINLDSVLNSNAITSQQIDRGKVETVTDFIFLGSRITADGNCSHKTKRQLLLGRKPMTNLDNMLKTRDITLPTKVRLDTTEQLN